MITMNISTFTGVCWRSKKNCRSIGPRLSLGTRCYIYCIYDLCGFLICLYVLLYMYKYVYIYIYIYIYLLIHELIYAMLEVPLGIIFRRCSRNRESWQTEAGLCVCLSLSLSLCIYIYIYII